MSGIAKFPRPITTAYIRLTAYAFTGEYTGRFQLRSLDPHQCQCGVPLQMVHYAIAACPLHAALRRQFLMPVSNTFSISAIFDPKEGGSTLGHSLATSQAFIRSKPPPDRLKCRGAHQRAAENTPPDTVNSPYVVVLHSPNNQVASLPAHKFVLTHMLCVTITSFIYI